jgi:hypothetical protein
MASAATTPGRPAYFDVLPSVSQAAEWMGVAPSSVTRAVHRLQIDTLPWGRERRLDVPALLDIARALRRFSPEEIAGDLLDHVEATAPQHLSAVQADIDRYFKSRSRRQASSPEAVIADLHQALPLRYAKQAEEIYRRALSTQ